MLSIKAIMRHIVNNYVRRLRDTIQHNKNKSGVYNVECQRGMFHERLKDRLLQKPSLKLCTKNSLSVDFG